MVFQWEPLPAQVACNHIEESWNDMRGSPVAGRESDLVLSVSKGGTPVKNLQPYLGAYGHLVALRTGDLAYLHTHPSGAADEDTGGPDIAFAMHLATRQTHQTRLRDYKTAKRIALYMIGAP